MRLFTNLLFKVTLSSMIATTPAMINGSKNDVSGLGREPNMPYYSTSVIKKFVDRPTLTATPLYQEDAERVLGGIPAAVEGAEFNPATKVNLLTAVGTNSAPVAAVKPDASDDIKPAPADALKPAPANEAKSAVADGAKYSPEDGERSDRRTFSDAKSAEVRMVINEAVIIYADMELEKSGLDEKAFEYAWRGYHNLLKKKMIRKKSMLSICDFSQSSCSKRMYVIDVRHRKLLYRTYVAHGQNSGAEYATSFSNEPDSYKSSLGFYITRRTYFGRNGLSLRIDGVDTGYNDMAGKRNIVLHGSSYATDKYMADYGTLGTSLGCPALPSTMSPRIIRAVKNGSCLFIYAPTTTYLENSTVINGSNNAAVMNGSNSVAVSHVNG